MRRTIPWSFTLCPCTKREWPKSKNRQRHAFPKSSSELFNSFEPSPLRRTRINFLNQTNFWVDRKSKNTDMNYSFSLGRNNSDLDGERRNQRTFVRFRLLVVVWKLFLESVCKRSSPRKSIKWLAGFFQLSFDERPCATGGRSNCGFYLLVIQYCFCRLLCANPTSCAFLIRYDSVRYYILLNTFIYGNPPLIEFICFDFLLQSSLFSKQPFYTRTGCRVFSAHSSIEAEKTIVEF